MGATKFSADLKQIYRVGVRLEKDEPRVFRWAIARLLNDMAFTARPIAIRIIGSHMMVRKKSYVKKTMRFGRTNGRIPVAAQVSWMGAIALDDRTGWVEQQFGTRTDQKPRHGLASRGGNERRTVRKKRYRTGKAYTRSQFKGSGNKKQHDVAMIQQLRDWNEKDAQFIQDGEGLLAKGIYGFDGDMNAVWLSSIDTAPETRRFRWLDMTRNRLMLSYPVMKKFRKEYLQQMSRRLR